MRIGVIQASSQCAKNKILYEAARDAAPAEEVINFGSFETDRISCSYVETAVKIAILLNSGAVDFIVTGCSSGQGMMLACNALPGILCGYTPTPQDAFLFGRINNGNAVSFPLGLNFGWAGEINLRLSLQALFSEPFGIGYPPQDAQRKQKDAALVKNINRAVKCDLASFLNSQNCIFVQKILSDQRIIDDVIVHGKNTVLQEWIVQNSKNRYGI